jgi:hypothetical protein
MQGRSHAGSIGFSVSVVHGEEIAVDRQEIPEAGFEEERRGILSLLSCILMPRAEGVDEPGTSESVS